MIIRDVLGTRNVTGKIRLSDSQPHRYICSRAVFCKNMSQLSIITFIFMYFIISTTDFVTISKITA